MRDITRRRVEGSLFPQDYRLRQDPLSGTRYLACTFVWEGTDTVNGDGFADIDYWQATNSLLARAAVPMVCKAGFRAYAVAMAHQEAGPLLPSSGFGECFVASFPAINPALKGYEPGDPWWLSGCIGPQSAQPEILLSWDCPVRLVEWAPAYVERAVWNGKGQAEITPDSPAAAPDLRPCGCAAMPAVTPSVWTVSR